MNTQDIQDWAAYLANCTPAQVRGVYHKELNAGRGDVAAFVRAWAEAAGLEIRSGS